MNSIIIVSERYMYTEKISQKRSMNKTVHKLFCILQNFEKYEFKYTAKSRQTEENKQIYLRKATEGVQKNR